MTLKAAGRVAINQSNCELSGIILPFWSRESNLKALAFEWINERMKEGRMNEWRKNQSMGN